MMNDDQIKTPVDKELLARFLRGESLPAEQEQVKLLLNQPGWKQALEELLKADFETFPYTPYTEAENAAWKQHFRNNYAEPRHTHGRALNIRWIGYAAACLLLLSVCFYYFRPGAVSQQQVAMQKRFNPKGQRSVITLPDSTIVYLGAASTLQYPETFGAGNREVSLQGEAYFEVSHDKSHPFIITTGKIQTKVLGTTFSINAFKDVIVSVTTGKVQVARQSGTSVPGAPLAVLTPGKQATWNAKTGKTTLAAINIEEVKEWKEGKVTFANTALAEVAETLERWYNVDIRFKDAKIADTKLSMIVRSTVPVQHSIDIICSTLHLKYHISGRTIVIRP